MNTKWIKRIKRLFDHKAIVLMYHRVADLLFDPFELGVSPENFEKQLQVLTKKYNVIKVSELVRQLRERSVASKTVCVSFDDGYWDNYFTARPLLNNYQCPASFYIVSGSVGNTQPFWWDELQHIFLNNPRLPKRLSLVINGERVESELENDGVLTNEQWQKHRKWLFTEQPVSQRSAIFVRIWERLKPLASAQREKVLEELRSLSQSCPFYKEGELPINDRQLRTIAGNPLFEIGVHTISHPSLSLLDRKKQCQEVESCRDELETRCHKPIHTLSYPYGDYNEETLSVVKEQKMLGGLTTGEHIVTKRTDPYCMGRFQVKNWSGKEFEKRLTAWFNQY